MNMKKYALFPLIFFLLCSILPLSAQTLEQAKTMFINKQYDKAKPVFQKYMKSTPTNASYNYWYGVCCLKTDEVEESIKPLELAMKKEIQNAPFFLGEAYKELWYFDDAVRCYETYIGLLKKKKEDTYEAEKLLDECKIYARMLKGIEDVCIIDSFVVDKENFLKAYKISEESGKLYTHKEFFKTSGNSEATVYETELGNIVYYSERGNDNTLSINTRIKMQDGWSKPTPLPNVINDSANVNYPFVLTDGITIYYASDGSGSLGGYDIFVTRYNSSAESYLAPENLGMPFNSSFNDYMYAIDEYNNLGWFASDRYQSGNKVCVYVFVPNKFKKTYNYESMKHKDIISLSQLRSLKETWKDEKVVAQAKASLKKALSQKPKKEKVIDFEFIIDDKNTYYSLNEFKSIYARELFIKYRQLERDYQQRTDELNKQREQYANTNKEGKNKLVPGILDLEKRVYKMSEELDQLIINVRYEEKNITKK
ncbi:hypothetical protein EZS27_003542 [termite gut metagenome]|uniref:Tetratricopeptide repeat protein n=1 Tax=termite gut metagenome TaxID=433724 RepID=A0A5J4SV27_9ZZZZ